MAASPIPRTTTEVIEAVRVAHPELFVAPAAPPWPDGVPDGRYTPAEAYCRDNAGRDLGEGTWLPQAFADVVGQRETALRVYPSRCQAAIDALVASLGGKSLCAAAGDGVADVAVTHANADAAKPPPGHTTWTVAKWSGASFLSGAVVATILILVSGAGR